MAFLLRAYVQFQRHDWQLGDLVPSVDIGVLAPIADAPLEVGVEFGPCALLLSPPEQLAPTQRPEVVIGVWDGARWRVRQRSGDANAIEPKQYLLLPTKPEMEELEKHAGVSSTTERWALMCKLETLN